MHMSDFIFSLCVCVCVCVCVRPVALRIDTPPNIHKRVRLHLIDFIFFDVGAVSMMEGSYIVHTKVF